MSMPALRGRVACSQNHEWVEDLELDAAHGEWLLTVNKTICPTCGRIARKLRGIAITEATP